MVLSRHPYPDHGKYTDCRDRIVAAGVPFATHSSLFARLGRGHVRESCANLEPKKREMKTSPLAARRVSFLRDDPDSQHDLMEQENTMLSLNFFHLSGARSCASWSVLEGVLKACGSVPRRISGRLVAISLFGLGCCFAQADRAALTGTITDPTHAAVPNANVKVVYRLVGDICCWVPTTMPLRSNFLNPGASTTSE